MIQKIFNAPVLAVALSAVTLLPNFANAQTATPTLPATAAAAPFKSAFESYKPYSDDKMTSWKAANDEVERIGGWREYAKQAQQPDNTPTPAAKAAGVKPKASP